MALRLLTLSLASVALAEHQGDEVVLVQQSLHSATSPAEADAAFLSDGVLNTVGGLVNMMKFENVVRQSILDLGSESHHLTPPTTPPRKSEQVAERLALQRVPIQEHSPTQAPVVEAAALPNCTAGELVHMNVTMQALTDVLQEGGAQQLAHVLPQVCGEVFKLGVNYSNLDKCIQQALEISPKCSQCHVNLMKGVAGTDLFHLACYPKCVGMITQCSKADEPKSQKACLLNAGSCLECSMPSLRQEAACIGGAINHKEPLDALSQLATNLRSGHTSSEMDLATELRRVVDAMPTL